jgi:hypothetical protein
MKVTDVPYQVALWRNDHPGEGIPDGHAFIPALVSRTVVLSPRPGDLLPVVGRPGAAGATRDQRAGRQGREDHPRHGLGQAERFIRLGGAAKSVDRELEAKAGTWRGLRATLPTSPPARRDAGQARVRDLPAVSIVYTSPLRARDAVNRLSGLVAAVFGSSMIDDSRQLSSPAARSALPKTTSSASGPTFPVRPVSTDLEDPRRDLDRFVANLVSPSIWPLGLW